MTALLKADFTLWVARVASALTVALLVIGIRQFVLGSDLEAANWFMAAGGLGLIVFSAVQLHREARREAERLAAARAMLKPAAWLARRMCEQAVIESDGKGSSSGVMQQWLLRWYVRPRESITAMMEGGPPAERPLDILEARMRETVSLAAEAGEEEVRAADTAFNAFVVAANILNDLSRTVGTTSDAKTVQEAIPRARRAANQLAIAAKALEAVAPRTEGEPSVPADPKFSDEH